MPSVTRISVKHYPKLAKKRISPLAIKLKGLFCLKEVNYPIFLKGYSITGGSVMLDREVAREFLAEELKEMEIPKDIFKEALIETFCKYIENDYYEWLKDNFKSFFNYGNPDWQWIRERIKKHHLKNIRCSS